MSRQARPAFRSDMHASALIVLALIASIATSIAFATLDNDGYQLSAYRAVPLWAWGTWLAAVAGGWTIVLAVRRDGFVALGGFVLFLAGLQITMLPRLAGMVAPDGGDHLTHAGHVQDILRTGTFSDNPYPAMHVWDAALVWFLGIDVLELFAAVHLPVMYTVFVVAVGLAARFLADMGSPVRRFTVGMGLAAMPVVALHKTVVTTSGWTLLLMPLVLLAIGASLYGHRVDRRMWAVPVMLLVILFALAHPMSNVVLALAIVGVITFAWLYRDRTRPERPGQITALVTLLLLVLTASLYWTLNTDLGENQLQDIYVRFDETPSSPPSAVGIEDRATELGLPTSEVLKISAIKFIPMLFVAGAAGLGLWWTLLQDDAKTRMRRQLFVLAAGATGFLLLVVAGAGIVTTDFGLRGGRYFFYSAGLLLPAAAAGIANRRLWSARMVPLALAGLLVIGGVGLLDAYKSPPTNQAWDAVPPSEFSGAQWWMESKVPEQWVFIGPAAGNYRYAHAVYGTSGVEEERPDLVRRGGFQPIGPSNNYPKVPDHFGFEEEAGFLCRVPGPSLVFMPQGEFLPYTNVWTEAGRFTAEEIEDWQTSGSGGRIFDSGPDQARIHLTPAC